MVSQVIVTDTKKTFSVDGSNTNPTDVNVLALDGPGGLERLRADSMSSSWAGAPSTMKHEQGTG